MYEYLKYFDSNFWAIFSYCVVVLLAGCYYLSLAITGIHLNRLSSVPVTRRISTHCMSALQAAICTLVIVRVILPIYSDYKIGINLVIFQLGILARYFYWKNLSILFRENKLLQLFYNIVIIGASTMVILHLTLFFTDGAGQCCLATSVLSKSDNYIVRVSEPFQINSLLNTSLFIYFLMIIFVYFRFLYLSYKFKDYAIFFGICISIIILGYFLGNRIFHFTYYAPIFFLMDIIVYTQMQKIEVKQISAEFELNRSKEKMFIHDIANPLHYSWMRLRKLVGNKSNFSLTDEKDVEALYNATSSAIDILNKYRDMESPRKEVSEVVDKIICMFPEIEIYYIAPEVEVVVDSRIIQNALINLVKNSIEALGDDLQWIKIMTFNYNDGIHIKYVDSGKYFNFKKPERAFKIGESRKVGPQEKGLGLASIRREIEEVGGSIELAEYQSNTCFDIYL